MGLKQNSARDWKEGAARLLLLICAAAAIFAVCAITFYMFAKGLPALVQVGIPELLFGTVWKPTATPSSYGIAYIHIHNTVNVAETEIFPRHIFEAFRYLPDFFLQF